MAGRARLTDVETVRETGSWLFTIRDHRDNPEEVVLVPCEDGPDPSTGVEAWLNRCTHEAQRFDRGDGAAIRGGQLVCPKHGSMFDTCTGGCDNGPAADTALVDVDVAVHDGDVYLVDDDATFQHDGGIDAADERDDGDDGPASTSHVGF